MLTNIALVVLIAVAIVLLAVSLARWISARSKEGRAASKQTKENESGLNVHAWVAGHIHYVLGGLAAGFKYVYRAWKRVPDGSPAELWWGIAFAAMIAVVAFAVIAVTDRALNGPRPKNTYRSEEFAHGDGPVREQLGALDGLLNKEIVLFGRKKPVSNEDGSQEIGVSGGPLSDRMSPGRGSMMSIAIVSQMGEEDDNLRSRAT